MDLPLALVVDDDTVSRLVLAHMLRRVGWDVIEADGLGRAVVAAVTHPITAVFCDYWMGTGHGLELLSALGTGDESPVFVLVTGSVEHTDAEPEDGLIVHARLTKPISTRSLNECLRLLRAAGSLPDGQS